MSYKHIENLYKNKTVLMFKRLYALEKLHGTSANLSFHFHNDENTGIPYYTVGYFSGGATYETFVKLFNEENLLKRVHDLQFNQDFWVYGEAYGGKMQGMSETYGKELKFAAFEVKIGQKWMNVPYAHEICTKLRLEFVHYEEIDADPEIIDKLANSASIQAQRNEVVNPKLPREGVVLRPLEEFLHPDGIGRIVAKHKNNIYKEREHAPKISNPEELKVLEDAKEIAQEWVVEGRLEHVLDKLKAQGMIVSEKKMNTIIKAMIEDIEREAEGEIVFNKQVRKAISQKTSKLFFSYLKKDINKCETSI